MKKFISLFIVLIFIVLMFSGCARKYSKLELVLYQYDWYTFMAESSDVNYENFGENKENIDYYHFKDDGTFTYSAPDVNGNPISGYFVVKEDSIVLTQICAGTTTEIEMFIDYEYDYREQGKTIPVLFIEGDTFNELYTDYDLFVDTYGEWVDTES